MRSALRIFAAMLLSVVVFGVSLDSAFAQTKLSVKANVDRKAIEPSDTVVFSVIVESGDEVSVQPPTLPPLSEFEVLSQWQSSSVQRRMVMDSNRPVFQTTRQAIFNWTLSPKRLGALTIFPVEVIVDGKSLRTQAVSVRVASGAGGGGRGRAQPPQGFNDQEDQPGGVLGDEDDQDLFSQLLRRGMRQAPLGGSRTLPRNSNEAFFIQVETDKTEAYVGEQVTVSFYLYTTGIIRDLDTLKYPSLKGFWKEDIEIATHLNFQQEVVDGVAYKKALLASFALFPIKEGSAVVDSYKAKCTVLSSNDPFGALGMGRAFTYTKASEPIKINVKPLPLEGRPQDFSGAVGDFQVTARVEDNKIVANQPFPLKIRFEGRGNAKLIDIPPFQAPEGLELYDTQKDSKFFGWGTSFKEFTLQLIPRRDGQFVIPAISASMFDPQTKKYITRSTEEIRLNAGAGSASQRGSQNFTASAGDRVSKPKGPTEPVIQEVFESKKSWTRSQAVMAASGLYGAVLISLLFVAAFEFGWGRGKPRLSRLIKNRVRDLDSLASGKDFRRVGVGGVNLLAFALREVVGDRVNEREVAKLLEATPPSIRKECGPTIQSVLERFEQLAFAPEAVVDAGSGKDVAKMKALIKETAAVLGKMVELSGSDEQDV